MGIRDYLPFPARTVTVSGTPLPDIFGQSRSRSVHGH